jgi:thioester reductase-like protein
MGVAHNTKGQSKISEEPIMDFRQGISNGYTQSKLVAEYMIQRAMESFGAWTSILRIGQIVGDTKLGLWNETEAAPLMIRSALTLGCLPVLDIVSLCYEIVTNVN